MNEDNMIEVVELLFDDCNEELENAIRNSQIMMIPGGFSAGDEPEGSGKFIATASPCATSI